MTGRMAGARLEGGLRLRPEADECAAQVSVVTVVRNGAATIEKTILSVLSQVGVAVEYIVVDGGSTDGTLEIIQKYNHRIAYWVSEPDSGIYSAMNKGISLANGDIVGILNADDYYVPDAVRNAAAALANHPECGYCYGWLALESQTGVSIGVMKPVPVALFSQRILREMVLPHPTMFVRKSIYETWGAFDCSFRLAADFELVARLHKAQVTGCEIPHIMAGFRMGGASANPLILREKRNISIAYGRAPASAWWGWGLDRSIMAIKRVLPPRLIGVLREVKQRLLLGLR